MEGFLSEKQNIRRLDNTALYVDAYYQFLDRPELVVACDIILVNCYPF
jgi:hypothetical protein